jgi:carbon storage regulator
MIILSRKRSQSIRIGNVVVTVLKSGRGGVRLGIDAPSTVPVVRCELESRADAGFDNGPRSVKARSTLVAVTARLQPLVDRTDAMAGWVQKRRLRPRREDPGTSAVSAS